MARAVRFVALLLSMQLDISESERVRSRKFLKRLVGRAPLQHEAATTLAPEPIPEALRLIYRAQRLLGNAFNYRFTIDGKIVGEIGEAIAESVFGLTRLSSGTRDHGMRAPDKRLVQVKATQGAPASRGVGLGSSKRSFKHLIVIEIGREGYYEVLYNGPGRYIDAARKHKKSASLSRRQLRLCQARVPAKERLPRLRRR